MGAGVAGSSDTIDAADTPAPIARITALFRDVTSPDSPLYFIAEKRFQTRDTRKIRRAPRGRS
jgi:hypothetical protein